MTATTEAPLVIQGLCRPIVDRTLIVDAEDAQNVLRHVGFEAGVSFVGDDIIRIARARAHELGYRNELSSPGGPVSNALYALAQSLGPYPRPIVPEWAGSFNPRLCNVPDDPLPQLRAAGVRTRILPNLESPLPESLCFVDKASGDTIAILVGHRLPMTPISGDDVDLQLLQLADIAAVKQGNGPLALMTADLPVISDELWRALHEVGLGGRLAFVFGSLEEFHRLGIVDETLRAAPPVLGAELVATDSSRAVQIWTAGSEYPETFDVDRLDDSDRGFLGAGDAYTGAYLGARLQGRTMADSHAAGQREARLTSYHMRARAPIQTNLNDLFGGYIERASHTPDWYIPQRVRQAPGPTIVSCLNSGVDTIAAEVSHQLGLPFFAIMPEGRRREDDGKSTDWLHVIELGTPSFRYCTWANVYAADGTLLLDISSGEGSQETRRAAHVLNRPILELSPDDDERTVFDGVREWARTRAVRTLHVAGSRHTHLSDTDSISARRVLETAAKALGSLYEWKLAGPPDASRFDDSFALGIPALREVSAAVRNYLSTLGMAESCSFDSLVWKVGAGEIVRARSRDLVKAVASGTLDTALVGEDMVLDENDARIEVVARAGLFWSSIALVVPDSPRPEIGVLGAQYPGMVRRLEAHETRHVVPVVGAGEGWVRAGHFDALVDTWRTGRTAHANGLALSRELARTSLCAIGRVGDSKGVDAARALLRGVSRGSSPVKA